MRGGRPDSASSADGHTDSSNAWRVAHDGDDSSRNRTQLEYTGDDIHWGCAARRQQKCPNRGSWLLLRFSTNIIWNKNHKTTIDDRFELSRYSYRRRLIFFFYLRMFSIFMSCVCTLSSTSSNVSLADAMSSKLGPLKIKTLNRCLHTLRRFKCTRGLARGWHFEKYEICPAIKDLDELTIKNGKNNYTVRIHFLFLFSWCFQETL